MHQLIRQLLTRNLLSILGWTTNRKIVVIESDDWGSIRMPSRKAYEKLLNDGIPVNKDLYCQYDTLASEDDLTALFETLKKHKDKNGNHPVITANTIVANPDFEKIKACNFSDYHYELFTDTLKRSLKHSNSFKLWEQGIKDKIFMPQFHGREHLNVKLWMEALQKGNREVSLAFNEGVFGIPVLSKINMRGNYMAAFDYQDRTHLIEIIDIIKEGLDLFETIFHFRSSTLMAPCYTWPKEIEPVLVDKGIFGLQGISYQHIPVPDRTFLKKTLHFNGEKNKYGQRYLVRNAFFEPTHYPLTDYTKEIIDRIKISFFWKKPVIISSHRLNFIGSLSEQNRKVNLNKFDRVLKAILTSWPDVEFMSSAELLETMNQQ
ncbi:MAG: hypothetical protein WCI92_16360 [Bacteroidota bacterium]